jgi:sulfonate transport system substrate-binding protein
MRLSRSSSWSVKWLPASAMLWVCALSLVSLGLITCQPKVGLQEKDAIRIGWQTAWATQGQLAQILTRTNLLSMNGIEGKFTGFPYGGPLNEAASAGEVDLIFTADQPAASLIASGADWVIIGRLMYNRVALYVPPESEVRTIVDLKGLTVAMPFGAAAQRVAFKAMRSAGLDPEKDVHCVNLGIYEQGDVVRRGSKASWGEIDAMAGFDPTAAIFEHEGLARILHSDRVVAVLLMDRKYLDSHPRVPVRILVAVAEAYRYYASHRKEADRWFREASQLECDDVVLEKAAMIEPNLGVQSINDVVLGFSDADLASMEESAEFLYEQHLIKNQIDLRSKIDKRFAEGAVEFLRTHDFDVSSVVVEEKRPSP